MNLPNLLNAKKRTNEQVDYLNFEQKNLSFLGANKRYFLRTYGCQMNEHDSENIRGLLENVGFERTDILEEADIILLNTCAIRENVHNKVFGLLGRIKHLKEKNNPNLIIGICGCMTQEENVVNEILDKYKWIDFVIGTHNLHDLINMVEKSMAEKKIKVEVFSKEGNVVEGVPVRRDSKISAWVNIILGCDKFCTYCIVPYARGKQRSRKKEKIIEEIINLKKEGYKEVTLLGQNVNAYGKDIYDNYDLSNLLEDVAKTNIERIRFITSHPWDFTDRMIEVISKYKNIMPYIHLPIQSGSNKILKLMGRRYTKNEYIELYQKIKERIENVTITTDIIVGFPGETTKDFNETLEIVNKCKFDGAYTFIYSPREGTPASKMKQIDEITKSKRLKKLNILVNKYSNESNQRMVDSIQKCLITGYSEKDSKKITGYTENMKLVNIECDSECIGKIINVKIRTAKSFSLDGEAI